MKICLRLMLIFLLCLQQNLLRAQKTYVLITKKTGKLNRPVITALPPELKGLAALYSAMGGTDCIELQCGLTTALGLGNQGSDDHKKIIKKYFPDDKVANLVIGQDCYLSPSSSSSFSNFSYLAFTKNGSNIEVNYTLDVINRGALKQIKGPDIYTYSNQVFKSRKRVLYAWASK